MSTSGDADVGISDRYHFAWLQEALGAFEADTGRLGAIGRARPEPALWALAARRIDPALGWLRGALGGSRVQVRLFDKFADGAPGVEPLDLNALDALSAEACDVLALFRGSYFIGDPEAFLAGARRVIRAGGLAVVDWLHGLSDAPVLDLRGDPSYGGWSTPFLTTYADVELLSQFPGEFDAFIRHVNRPPGGPRAPRSARASESPARAPAARSPAGRSDARDLSARCRAALEGAGKHLVEPALLDRYFRVVFRHARYFYPLVGKFNLYVLTVLEPVGK